ncbi:MAG: hypothetical protein ACK4IX_01225 [Candidatus Sericytochromatia bacterium]
MTTISNRIETFLIDNKDIKTSSEKTNVVKTNDSISSNLSIKDNFDNKNLKQGNIKTEINFLNSESKTDSKNGIWIWNTNDIPKSDKDLDSFLKLASKKGINNLYVNGHPSITNKSDIESFKKLVIKASENNVKIEVLLGNPEWVNDPKQEKVFKEKYLNSFIDFWKDCPENSKPNLHLDIEPHCLPEWKNNKNELMEKTISLYSDVNKILEKSGVKSQVSADIPHWWDDFKMKNGKSAFENISEKVSSVAIMAYGENSQKVNNFVKDELSSPQNKKLITAIETDGLKLVGWDNNDKEIKGSDLKKSFLEINKTSKNISIHPRPNTDLLKMISSLPDN